MAIYGYPGDKVLARCDCGKLTPMAVPDRCPACEVKREGILDQAEPGIDFDSPKWLERQAREHPAQDVTPGRISEATSPAGSP